jgi:PadR family transcriptional regulator, regulatory protein PadR
MNSRFSRLQRTGLVQSSLDLPILQSLLTNPRHGWAIAKEIQQISPNVLPGQQGALYPALHRLEQQGWIKAHQAETEAGGAAKFYQLTRATRTLMESDSSHEIHVRNLPLAAMSLALGMGANAANSAGPSKVPVCLTPNNYVSTFALNQAENVASKILGVANVQLEWHSHSPPVCRGLDQVKPVMIDFTRDAPPNQYPGAMAVAHPYEGIHIVVMYDRIEQYTAGPGQLSSVLGNVMAHEIVHTLEGLPHHSETGLMKAHWSTSDLWKMAYKPLPLGPEDIDLIERGLHWRADKRTPAPTALQAISTNP